MRGAEARQQAEAERLTLLVADNGTGSRLDMNQMSWHESMFRAQLKPLSCY